MTRSLIGLCPLLVALALAPGSGASPPAGLNGHGRALWNFEALLHDTFGKRPVCVDNRLNFSAKQCRLGAATHYVDVFSSARHSAFHLARHRPDGDFGIHPFPVRVNGRFVACDLRERTYLVVHGDSANFALSCTEPLR